MPKLSYQEKKKKDASVVRKSLKSFARYYFWEWVPSYGLRQIGKTDGYRSLQVLMKEQDWSIQHNKEEGYPSFILKGRIVKRL